MDMKACRRTVKIYKTYSTDTNKFLKAAVNIENSKMHKAHHEPCKFNHKISSNEHSYLK